MPELTTVEKPKIAGFVDSKFKNANERRIAEAEAELESVKQKAEARSRRRKNRSR